MNKLERKQNNDLAYKKSELFINLTQSIHKYLKALMHSHTHIPTQMCELHSSIN